MGNSIVKFLCGGHHSSSEHEHAGVPAGASRRGGVAALRRDIANFELTQQVPDGLSQFVVSSRKAQCSWYKKLQDAWEDAHPPPRTPEEAAALIVRTLKRHQRADVEGLLEFYGLSFAEAPPDTIDAPPIPSQEAGVKYELYTLPVDARSVADGDTVTVYVDTASPRESGMVPLAVREAAISRAKARAVKDYPRADAHMKIITDAGYKVIWDSNSRKDVLARKYRIRLRGIDAPESAMPYGKEAKEELVRLIEGKPLSIGVYGEDQYGRCVGDVYCNKLFIQEQMLKKGLAWHYVAYDRRAELAHWEKQARAARIGLWASKNPEEPWEWRRVRRNQA